VDEVIEVWTVIRVDDHRDGEHAGVRENLKVDGHLPTLPNPNRYSCADFVPAEGYRLGGTADMRDKRVESVLVIHVEAVSTGAAAGLCTPAMRLASSTIRDALNARPKRSFWVVEGAMGGAR
jgi:hypothetical protein